MIQKKKDTNPISFTTNPACADLVLYESTRKEYAKYSQILQAYTNNLLKEWCSVFFKFLKKKSIAIAEKADHCEQFIQEFSVRPSSPAKITAINFLSIFWANNRNLATYLNTLPEQEQIVWRHVVRNWYIESREAKKLSGIDFTLFEESYWHSIEYHKTNASSLFILTSTSRYSIYNTDNPCYLYLPEELRRQLLPWALNQSLEALPTCPEPPLSSLTVFNCEKNIFTEISLINGMHMQGTLDVNEKGKLTASQIKAAIKIIAPVEFFCDGTNINGTGSLRAQLLFTVQALLLKTAPKEKSNPASIKQLFTKVIPAYFYYLIPLLLPHITGLKSNEYRQISFRSALIDQLLSIIETAEGTPWIPVHELLEYLQYKKGSINYWKYIHMSQLTNKWEKEQITLDFYYPEVIKPLYLGFLFLMAAFGLLDLAYTPLTEKSQTAFETLRYIRLTPLGSYVLGKQPNYTIQALSDTQVPYFSLDEHMLVIRALQENNPYESFLSNISTHIGLRRYRVSPSSVLAQCKNLQDVENTIQFFKQYICENPPQIWKEFFLSLLRRSQSIQPVKSEQYVVLQLNKQDEELLKLISTHPDIRKYASRAEDHLLLVKKDKLNQFTDLLKAHGYLF
ncbi:MAG: hypothetical protein PHC95_00435 [Parabacteroides sp.]|nr:hypothetical protein [Parabacteroides sp.]